MNQFRLIIFIIFIGQSLLCDYVYSDKLIYPIIFIHGLGGNDQRWYETGVDTMLENRGLSNGGTIDICLDMKHNNLSESDISADIETINETIVPVVSLVFQRNR